MHSSATEWKRMALRRSTLWTPLLSITCTARSPLVDPMASFTSGMVSTKNDSVSSGSKHQLLVNYITDRLQRILNAVGRLVLCTCKFDLALSSLLHSDLHWLDVPERINYKLNAILFIASCRRKFHGIWSTVHTSFGSCQSWTTTLRPWTTTLSQWTPPYCATAFPTEQVWALGLFGRRSYFVVLFTGSSHHPTRSSYSFRKLR